MSPRLGGRRLTFDFISFIAVFLLLPLAIFLIFVISPFVQALYYAMTNWTGFSPNMDFVGLDNYVRLFNDSTFKQAMLNNVVLALIVPLFIPSRWRRQREGWGTVAAETQILEPTTVTLTGNDVFPEVAPFRETE